LVFYCRWCFDLVYDGVWRGIAVCNKTDGWVLDREALMIPKWSATGCWTCLFVVSYKISHSLCSPPERSHSVLVSECLGYLLCFSNWVLEIRLLVSIFTGFTFVPVSLILHVPMAFIFLYSSVHRLCIMGPQFYMQLAILPIVYLHLSTKITIMLRDSHVMFRVYFRVHSL
jgi:hypothetical protein